MARRILRDFAKRALVTLGETQTDFQMTKNPREYEEVWVTPNSGS
jgi:hypothetical protein